MDMGLTQLGLDSLSLMALAQALNQKFEINGNIGITPADVFMIGRAKELVELVSQKLENEEDGEEEDSEVEEEEDNEDTEEGEENEESDTDEEEFNEDEKREDEDDNDERKDDEENERESENEDKNEEEEKEDNEEAEEDEELEEERKSEDCDEENRDEEEKEAQNKNEDREEEDGYETEDEEEEEENEENLERDLPVSKEETQNFKLARECIFTVEEFKTARKTSNENPNVWIEISNKNNFEIIFKIKRKDEREIRHSINMKNIKNNQKFEENVEMLFEMIYQGNGVKMEKDKTFTINLNLLNNSKNNKIFDKINLLKIHSNAILLLCRALLLIINKFQIKIILQLITNEENDQPPIFAYLRTFLQNFQVEMGNEFFEFFTSLNLSEWHFKKFLGKLNLGNNDDWMPQGTWLITGGTKGIGLEIAYWLTKHFPPLTCLILLARTKPNDKDIFWQYFKQMSKKCRVELKLCDVTDVERMKEIFKM
ncbi:unnamed protein product [Meloidogyne enterolobii]|uniref:Uncharacterized protein n=1 Tax=Meloidogyne enterolobii TaxID=390850 RepID=A0ACB1A4T1_MELEN